MKYKDPWAPAAKRLARKAKREKWSIVQYYDRGYRYGYLKTLGRKFAHIVILAYVNGSYKPRTKRFKLSSVLIKPNS